jgi:hypothetical protein
MSDDLKGIIELDGELRTYSNEQYAVILALKEENDKLKTEVLHLKTLLIAATPLVPVEPVKIEVSPEQAICEIQINKLQEKAQSREMTLEETKRLEILIKSLYLIKEKGSGAISAEYTNIPANTTLESLAQIASTPDPQSGSDCD